VLVEGVSDQLALDALAERRGRDLAAEEGDYQRGLEEVGTAMGFSRERARQVEMNALTALRRPEVRARLEDLADGARVSSATTRRD
jgi:DNA-directed RNA polymerase sigma subunit (sigma70/sigma32)